MDPFKNAAFMAAVLLPSAALILEQPDLFTGIIVIWTFKIIIRAMMLAPQEWAQVALGSGCSGGKAPLYHE